MNFDLTEEQQLLADSLKRYLTNEYSFDTRAKIVAFAHRLERDGVGGLRGDGPAGRALRRGARRLRRHRGGRDARSWRRSARALVVEPYWTNVGLGGRLIARGGSEAQQKRILPELIQGKHRLAFAHTERSAPLRPAATSARGPSAAGAASR